MTTASKGARLGEGLSRTFIFLLHNWAAFERDQLEPICPIERKVCFDSEALQNLVIEGDLSPSWHPPSYVNQASELAGATQRSLVMPSTLARLGRSSHRSSSGNVLASFRSLPSCIVPSCASTPRHKVVPHGHPTALLCICLPICVYVFRFPFTRSSHAIADVALGCSGIEASKSVNRIFTLELSYLIFLPISTA